LDHRIDTHLSWRKLIVHFQELYIAITIWFLEFNIQVDLHSDGRFRGCFTIRSKYPKLAASTFHPATDESIIDFELFRTTRSRKLKLLIVAQTATFIVTLNTEFVLYFSHIRLLLLGSFHDSVRGWISIWMQMTK